MRGSASTRATLTRVVSPSDAILGVIIGIITPKSAELAASARMCHECSGARQQHRNRWPADVGAIRDTRLTAPLSADPSSGNPVWGASRPDLRDVPPFQHRFCTFRKISQNFGNFAVSTMLQRSWG